MPVAAYSKSKRFVRIFVCLLCSSAVLGDVRQGLRLGETQFFDELDVNRYFAGGWLTGVRRGGYRQNARSIGTDIRFLENAGNSVNQQRIRALFQVLNGNLQTAEEIFGGLAMNFPRDAAIQNDLGVIQMGMAASSPLSWFRAIQQFRLALAIQNGFVEATYNLALVYRRLHLERLAAIIARDYEQMPGWKLALPKHDSDAASDMKSFEARIRIANPDEISSIVEQFPEYSRQLILEYAFRPILPIPPNYERVAQSLADRWGDNTAVLALVPLSTKYYSQIAEARHLVTKGRGLIVVGRLDDAHEAYELARNYIAGANSVFDRIWVELNDAEALVTLTDFRRAAPALRDVEQKARAYRIRWLLARALSVSASTPALLSRFDETMARLNEAVQVYRAIGERRELARALYYIAGYNYMAGMLEESLKFALQSLDAADNDDHSRLSQSQLLVSGILLRYGFLELAKVFDQEAMDQAEQIGNPAILAAIRSHLATLYLAAGSYSKALDEIEKFEQVVQKMPEGNARSARQLSANLVRARIALAQGHLAEAESVLRSNIQFAQKNPAVSGPHIHAQSHFYLAKTFEAQQRRRDAAGEFSAALNIVDNGQQYFSNIDFQVAFDQERRELYESAIRFELDHSTCEESWNLMQAYKARLFLEILNKFEPAVSSMSTRKLTVTEVKRRTPSNLQIIDYAVLRDRVIAWVISKEAFQCRSIPIDRYQLERAVISYIGRLRAREAVENSSRELYELIVQPFRELLTSGWTTVIVPDGILHRLPFASLLSSQNTYFIEMMPIVESPSITYFFGSGENAHLEDGNHTAFGPRTYDALTMRELRTVQQIEPDMQVLVGPGVTKTAFLDAVRRNKILYYAGHSAMDLRNPLQASILLDGNIRGPNTISALDIIEQRMPKNAMVILSSCETSLGNSIDGPGIRGLTSAFLVAGAGTVIGSIWPVESANTMKLISATFGYLVRKHESVAESLRASQIQLIHTQLSHPYYWSAFVVTGNLSAITKIEKMSK